MVRARKTCSSRMLGLPGALAMCVLGGGCVERPDEAMCRAMADHVVELERASQEGRAAELIARAAERRHPMVVATCVEDGTLEEVRCVLETRAKQDLPSCAPQ